jgi:hypothetical protein
MGLFFVFSKQALVPLYKYCNHMIQRVSKQINAQATTNTRPKEKKKKQLDRSTKEGDPNRGAFRRNSAMHSPSIGTPSKQF